MSERKVQLVERIRLKIESRDSSSAGFANKVRVKPIRLERPEGDFSTEKDCYHLSDFLQHYDKRFIRFAYLALLNRDVDSQGLKDRLETLRVQKVSRIDLLGRLRYGPEGKARGVRVKGLFFAFVIARLSRLSVIGLFVRLPTALLKISETQRELEYLRGLIEAEKTDGFETDKLIVNQQNAILSVISSRKQ